MQTRYQLKLIVAAILLVLLDTLPLTLPCYDNFQPTAFDKPFFRFEEWNSVWSKVHAWHQESQTMKRKSY